MKEKRDLKTIRIIALLLAAVMLFSLVSCSRKHPVSDEVVEFTELILGYADSYIEGETDALNAYVSVYTVLTVWQQTDIKTEGAEVTTNFQAYSMSMNIMNSLANVASGEAARDDVIRQRDRIAEIAGFPLKYN